MKYGLKIPSFALGPSTASLSIDHLLLTPPAYACTWLEPIALLAALAGVKTSQ